MIIKLKVQNYDHRNNIIVGIASAGYKVWVEKNTYLATDTYYVCFEYPEPEQKTPTYSMDNIPCSGTHITYPLGDTLTYTNEPCTHTVVKEGE